MKKFLAVLMCAVIAILFCACSSDSGEDINVKVEDEEPQAIQEPENAGDTQSDMPQLSDETPVVQEVPVSAYRYTPFTLEESGFYMEIPSHWERRPASKSIYFVEPVNDGEIPGRIVVTSKKLTKIKDSTRETELRSFFSNILGDFDTYEWSEVYTDQSFMGDSKALWVTYSGTRAGLAYRGYVILGVKNTTVYVFHFRCADNRFYEFDSVIDHVRDSITFN